MKITYFYYYYFISYNFLPKIYMYDLVVIGDFVSLKICMIGLSTMCCITQ